MQHRYGYHYRRTDIVVLLLYKLDKIYPTIMKDLAEREARGEM